jgi:mono/diheme cytochrome c family protein
MKNKMSNRFHLIPMIFILMLSGLVLSVVTGCDVDTRSEVERGEALYVAYCQMCHGETGDGPMADLLKTPPTDLTTITQRYGGKFPDDQITKQVEGKERIMGHADSDMPVFWVAIKNGENLQEDHEVEERIDALVAYLKAIQKKG